ncbi:MAG: RNA degradosome polyphosphate kinase, partial [Pseudomonadota bacterium]
RIQRETKKALAGRKAAIYAKMNSLTEPSVIQALYEASRAGVEIKLVVRGICCLRPGIAGLSENIRVRSILGRFLEHSRIYHFHNDGESETWAASADWMERNLFQRVEVCFPINGKKAAKRVLGESILLAFEDNRQAWELQGDGSYRLIIPAGDEQPLSAQEFLIEQASHAGA